MHVRIKGPSLVARRTCGCAADHETSSAPRYAGIGAPSDQLRGPCRPKASTRVRLYRQVGTKVSENLRPLFVVIAVS